MFELMKQKDVEFEFRNDLKRLCDIDLVDPSERLSFALQTLN